MRILKTVCVAAAGLSAVACSSGDEPLDLAVQCHVGAWQFAGDRFVDIAPVTGSDLRWRADDGRVGRLSQNEDGLWRGNIGWTDQASPAVFDLGVCDDEIQVAGLDGLSGDAHRVPLEITDVSFSSGDLTLAGRLVLPGERAGPVPVVVLIHGSESSSALDYAYHARMLPARGVGVFVYDKRGTGSSTGSYSQDFHLLAADAAEALEQAREMAGDQASSFGYFGGSQGGWVSPLAAQLNQPDFVMIGFGMTQSPTGEDAEEVQSELRAMGYGADVLAQAREVTDATGLLMASRFEQGQDARSRVISLYGDEDWFGDIQGEYTGDLLAYPPWLAGWVYKNFNDVGTRWDHQPVPVLESLDIPMLWVLAAEDREAPSAQTLVQLQALQESGRDIDIVVYPQTDHGIMTYIETDEGARAETGYADGYFQLVADWSHDQSLQQSYGDGQNYPAANR